MLLMMMFTVFIVNARDKFRLFCVHCRDRSRAMMSRYVKAMTVKQGNDDSQNSADYYDEYEQEGDDLSVNDENDYENPHSAAKFDYDYDEDNIRDFGENDSCGADHAISYYNDVVSCEDECHKVDEDSGDIEDEEDYTCGHAKDKSPVSDVVNLDRENEPRAQLSMENHSASAMYVDVEVFGKSFRALVDSGANICVIKSNYVPKRVRINDGFYKSVNAFDGRSVRLEGTAEICLKL